MNKQSIDLATVAAIIGIVMVVWVLSFPEYPLQIPTHATSVKNHGNGWYSWSLDGHSFLQNVRTKTVVEIK